jgi:DNA-binding Lrp family transcriptional regulator
LALATAIGLVPNVRDADAITGEFDVIASVEARDLADLRQTMTAIQGIEGVRKTITCVVLSDRTGFVAP